MATIGLSSPGGSSYTSNLMHVGDGTWDSTRDDFLLPNLQGLNFATTQYNGMGNRFKGLPQYHTLILGHGVLAAITFIGILPLAIFLAKYGHDWPGGRVSFKLHVYLNILVVFLATVILVLGWFAVGPERSLSNPHHGIGVAIYTLILFQFLYGSCWFRRERRRTEPPRKLPLTVWLHRVLGRGTALLAFVQIGLGLTLYGSSKVLFILYAVAGAILGFLYLALDYYFKPYADGTRPDGRFGFGGRGGSQYSDYGSYYGSYLSGSRRSRTDDGRRNERRENDSHWGRKLLAAAGVLGTYEAWKHRRDKRREERDGGYDGSSEIRSEVQGQNQGQYGQGQAPSVQYGQGYPPPGQAPYGQPNNGQYGQGQLPPGQPDYGRGQPPNQPNYGPGQPPYGPPPAGAGAWGNVDRQRSQNQLPPQSRGSRESWEDEKYSDRSQRPGLGRRILEATGVFSALYGAKRLFGGRSGHDDDYDSYDDERNYNNGSQNAVSQQDVSRVRAGEAPGSPNTPRANLGGAQPMTPSETPQRQRPRHVRTPSASSNSYDDRDSYDGQAHHRNRDSTFTDNVRELGPIAGFREWNRQRKARREAFRADRTRVEQEYKEDQYNKRNSNNYPRPEDANGRRESGSGTEMTGPSGPETSRSNFHPDTNAPPLPVEAGALPSHNSPLGNTGQTFISPQAYQLPPPPPGPPPQGLRSDGYGSREQFGSAYMPQGAVNPDPARLLANNTAANEGSAYGRDTVPEQDQRNASLSPSRPPNSRSRYPRTARRGSTTSASRSRSQATSAGAGPSSSTHLPGNPPVAIKMRMANDGQHVELRRLNDQQAAAERESRRQIRRDRRAAAAGRDSSASAIATAPTQDDPPPGQRYRRTSTSNSNGAPLTRPSTDQPITNIPLPPPLTSAQQSPLQPDRRVSELNLPPPVPQHNSHTVSSPPFQGISPPTAGVGQPPPNESGIGSSPGAYGTDTESRAEGNRRRRRAERARVGGNGARVEFQ